MDFKVKLLSVTGDPQLIVTAGALGCFEEGASSEILERLLSLSAEERDKKIKAVIKNSFGMGHGSVGDQCCFIFSIEDLPRIATLQLCLPEFAAHLQQSLRRAKPERGFHLPDAMKWSDRAKAVMEKSFKFYEDAVKAGVPGEDARYPLPLYTRTNIQTAINARELSHIWAMSKKSGTPSIVKTVVGEMIRLAKEVAPYLFEDFGGNYEQLAWYPSSQLFAETNETMENLIFRHEKESVAFLGGGITWDGDLIAEALQRAIRDRDEAALAILKHVHFEFLAPMSLACFHQATRQRTWNQSVESIYRAAHFAGLGRKMFVPESIDTASSSIARRYVDLHWSMVHAYESLLLDGVPAEEAIGVLPHSLLVYDLIHVNGWNAIHSIGKRRCEKAQREVRRIAKCMAKHIERVAPVFRGFVEPQCVNYGRCPEKDSCGYGDRMKKK